MLIIITAIMSLAFIVTLFFLIDVSISYTHLKSSYQSQNQHKDIFRELLKNEWIGQNRDEIVEKINNLAEISDHMIVIKEPKNNNSITVNEINLFFEKNTLTEIN
ncbi:Imm58 family immunity protein [Vreelandella sp. GE22]